MNVMRIFVFVFLFMIALSKKDVPCEWNSYSGATFDLKPLTRYEPASSYYIRDGDIECTPEIEPSFDYAFNFCADVTSSSVNAACSDLEKSGPALQWLNFGKELSDCNIIGHYDPTQDDLYYKLLDPTDPSKGISMTYPQGEQCKTTQIPRKATIDVICDNTETKVITATEPTKCSYHLSVKSFYGCPTECKITSNGLCDSHGHCAYDYKSKQAYCFCNSGYSGNDCSSKSSSSTAAYDGFSVQLGLLITLLVITLILIGGIGFIVYKITILRKQQNAYDSLPSSHGVTEMVETVHF